MKLLDKEVSSTHRVLVFGEPKSGKTELAGELAKEFKLLWFDLENGFATLLKLPNMYKENIELISIPDTKTYPIAIETMLKVVVGNKVDICDTHGKVSCMLCKKEGGTFTSIQLNGLPDDYIVVIDSVTQLSNSAMNFLTKGQPDDYKPEWTDYRNQGQLLEKILSQIQQAKYNVVCITHVVETEMEDGRKKLVPVAGTANFSRNTAKYFDHVVYCEVKNRKHSFGSGTTYGNNILTGSRTDVAMENSDKPSLLEIFKKQPDVAQAVRSKTPAQVAESTLVQAVERMQEKIQAAEPLRALAPEGVAASNGATTQEHEPTKEPTPNAVSGATGNQSSRVQQLLANARGSQK